ncbi:hypothetical protein ACJ41O_006863 [Fusarium nematophilum]
MRCSSWLKPAYLASSIAFSTALTQHGNDQQVILPHSDDAPHPQPRKNIVFILTDDQDAVLDSVAYMPKLHKHIIDKGTSFANHFTTTAICCPSRVSLWTGKQPHNTNVTDVSPPYGGFPKFVSQGLNNNYLPVWLQEAGYKTYYTGKLFNAHTINNYNAPYPAGWTGTNFLLDPGTYSLGIGVSWIRQLSQLNESSVSYIDDYYRARLQALQGVDEIVEQVVQQLDDAGLLDDTYIVYTSDNGFHLGQHRLPPGKECGFDEDIRVPLFVRGPGVAAGAVEDAVTTHIDLAPTLLRLAGVELRGDFDGAPIPVVPGLGSARHEHVAVEYWGIAIAEGEIGGFDGKGQIVAPNNTYKGVRIVHDDYDLYYSAWCSNEHELYDLKTDPGELNNLFPKGGHDAASDVTLLGTNVGQVISRLDALMLVLKSCRGESCVRPWKILHPDGDVASLKDALEERFDKFYAQQVKVEFDWCEHGYLVDAEGPQVGYQYREGLEWHHWT